MKRLFCQGCCRRITKHDGVLSQRETTLDGTKQRVNVRKFYFRCRKCKGARDVESSSKVV